MDHLRSEQEHEQFHRFLRQLFAANREESLEEELSSLPVPEPYRIRMKVLYSRGSLRREILQLSPSYGIDSLGDSGIGFQLQTTKGRTNVRQVRNHFAVFNTEQPRISVVASVSRRDSWKSLLRAFSNAYPQIVPVFLSQRELLEGVEELRSELSDFALRVREFVAKERAGGDSGRQTRSVREWTDERLESVLPEIIKREQTLSSINLSFHRRLRGETSVSPYAECKITKEGEVEITGRYTVVRNSVVEHFAQVGHEKLKRYSDRSLRDRDYEPAPLEIVYDEEVFDGREEVQNLVRVLTKYPHSNHAVQHGNPYAHVQVSDLHDGSSFDVWAVAPERITIIPQLKATEAGVERLIHYVFEEFREGRVEEYEQRGNALP